MSPELNRPKKMISYIGLLLVTMLVSTAAFSPSKLMQPSRGKALRPMKMNIEEIGVLPPTGFWDPLGK